MSTQIRDKLFTRFGFKFMTALVILGLMTGFEVISVMAVSIGGYEIDGVVPDDGATVFDDPFGAVAELGPVNSNLTKLGVINTAVPPMLSMTNPNAQVDLRRVWLDTNIVGNDVWLYFAWERDSNTGSGVIMYEFQKSEPPAECDYSLTNAELIAACNPWANRAPGDLIIVWDQKGKTINIIIRTFEYNDTNPANGVWDGNAAEPLYLDAGTTLDASVSKAAYSSDGYYGEAAINLSATIFPETPTECLSYGNVIPGTVTGNSDSADYKDTILSNYSGKISISNCGEVEVIKETVPDDLTGTFPFTLDQEDGGYLRFGGTVDEITGTLTFDGDKETYKDLIADTDYQLVEGDVGSAFAMTSIVCQVDDEIPVDITEGGFFAVKPSTITTCTITNEQQPGTLIVKKLVINDDGGALEADDFEFQVDGGAQITFITDPDQDPANLLMGKNSLTVDTGTYDVTEPAVDGYTTTYNNCTGVEVPAGGSATCAITNDDIGPTITLIKEVDNGDGGNAGVDDFGLTIGSTAVKSGETLTVMANTAYKLDEAGLTGYDFVSIGAGTGDSSKCPSVLGGSVTADPGEDIVCTIKNDDIAPTITLIKVLNLDNGGSAGLNDFGLSIGATSVDSGVALTVLANTEYELNETGLAGFHFESIGDGAGDSAKCPDVLDGKVTADEGENIVCTIMNDDDKAAPGGSTDMAWEIFDALTLNGVRPGAPGAAASVVFRLFSDDICTTQVGGDDLVSIVDNVASSSGFKVGIGTYFWQAIYSGDQYNEGFTTRCGYEVTTIAEAITLPWK